jgi:hypothetical protein
MDKKNKIKDISFYNKQKDGYKSCNKNSEKAKELHFCPFSLEIYGEKVLCDCNKQETNSCLEDI